jgi:filamentous hemagglutinin
MSIELPTSPSELGHIFRQKDGHLPDTPENRALLLGVANDVTCRLESDKHGNFWAVRRLDNGHQIWVRMRGSKIINAGMNEVPRKFEEGTGLNRP